MLKVSQLAKDMGLTPERLIAEAAKLDIEIKSADSSLGDAYVKLLKSEIKKSSLKPKKPQEAKKAKPTLALKKEPKKENQIKRPNKEKVAGKKSVFAEIKKVVKEKAQVKEAVEIKPVPKEVSPKLEDKKEVVQKRIEKPSEFPKHSHAPVKDLPRKTEVIKKHEQVEAKKSQVPPKPQEIFVAPKDIQNLQIKMPIVLRDLAVKISVGPNDIIKALLKKGLFVNINQNLGEDTLKLIGDIYGYKFEKPPTIEEELIKSHEVQDASKLLPRAPIVTFMGHVDHGKTSLLDTIKRTKVTEQEVGGITQHIGAYEIAYKNGHITFLDTPGHEAFTAMRSRGANATDVVVLVVASDDGIMPQTIEAIDHAKAADVPIVVAINKCDLPNANPEKVKKQLSDLGFMPEDWGGKTITVNVSAKTGEGIDNLLEMLLLEAEMLELKADMTKSARGIVIEAELSKGSGPIATVLVKDGTLKVGDTVVCGAYWGNVRAMIDDKGKRVHTGPPSKPIEILGLSGVPKAGDLFYVTEDEKTAKEVSLQRQERLRETVSEPPKRITLENLYEKIKEGSAKELRLVVKADVQGSLEALKTSLEKLSTDDIRLNFIHAGIGEINESDVILAMASNAVVIGFHIRISDQAQESADKEGVEVKFYRIIYEAISDVRAAMEGLLEPYIEEIFLGRASVKQVFKLSRSGIVAGSFVEKGKIPRNAHFKLIRQGKEVARGKFAAVKRFKDDVKEVAEGFECGISLANVNDIQVGDLIEAFESKKTARKLA